jgi:FkbM family methyltransferase
MHENRLENGSRTLDELNEIYDCYISVSKEEKIKKKYSVENFHNNKTFLFATYDNCIISNVIKKGNKWEPFMHTIFDKYITQDSIVLEGGCHIGTHTLKLASLCKHVHAFEPLPSSNKLLKYNLIINNINNVTLYSEGLSVNVGETEYEWVAKHNPGCAGLKNNPMGKINNCDINNVIKVSLTTIDKLELEKLDFIKLDVEGYESLVINGALNTIKKYKPIITLECWSSHKGTCCIEHTKTLFNNLIAIGYEIIQIDNKGPDFLFLPIN